MGFPAGNIFANLVPPASIKSGGSVWNLAISPQEIDTATISASYRQLDAELTLGYQGSLAFSNNASIAAVRGAVTIKAGTTISGAAYLYGVQGKLIVKGIHASSAEVSCGILGQLDLSAAQGLTGDRKSVV